MNAPRSLTLTQLKPIHINLFGGRFHFHTHDQLRIDIAPRPTEHELTPFITEFPNRYEITGKAPGKWFQTKEINVDVWLPENCELVINAWAGQFEVSGTYAMVSGKVRMGEIIWNVDEDSKGNVSLWMGKISMKHRQGENINYEKSERRIKHIKVNNSENLLKSYVFMGESEVVPYA